MSREMTEDEKRLMEQATKNLDDKIVEILRTKKAEAYTYEELSRGIRQLETRQKRRIR